MKKTFQKTLLAAAAGVALMGTASANSLLFPYFKVGGSVQSVISLSNAGTAAATEDIHYSFGYGSTCTHYDTWGKLTANDIISHSVAAPAIGGVGVQPSSDTSTAGYLPVNDTEGFLIVTNTSTNSVNALRGSLAVIEAATTGLFVSYGGIDNGLNTVSTVPGKYAAVANGSANEGNFALANLNATGFGPAAAALNFPLTWMPTATVTTSWWALAIGDMNSFARGASASWAGNFTLTNGQNNVWDNDENFRSGATGPAAGCQKTFAVKDLMTSAQLAAYSNDPVFSKGGGSGLYKGNGAVAGGADNVILMKLQKVTSGDVRYDRGTLMHREQGQAAAF